MTRHVDDFVPTGVMLMYPWEDGAATSLYPSSSKRALAAWVPASSSAWLPVPSVGLYKSSDLPWQVESGLRGTTVNEGRLHARDAFATLAKADHDATHRLRPWQPVVPSQTRG
jgi:hypothetical protein